MHWFAFRQPSFIFSAGNGKELKSNLIALQFTKNILANYLLNFVYSMVLCTLYTNLGLDAVEYGVGLTEAKVVVTSQELLPKLAKIIDRCPTVTHVVAFEEPWRGDLPHSIR